MGRNLCHRRTRSRPGAGWAAVVALLSVLACEDVAGHPIVAIPPGEGGVDLSGERGPDGAPGEPVPGGGGVASTEEAGPDASRVDAVASGGSSALPEAGPAPGYESTSQADASAAADADGELEPTGEGAGLCAPCTRSRDCGGPGDLCLIRTSTGEVFCGRDCSVEPCPSGYRCRTVGSASAEQCAPVSGTCLDGGT